MAANCEIARSWSYIDSLEKRIIALEETDAVEVEFIPHFTLSPGVTATNQSLYSRPGRIIPVDGTPPEGRQVGPNDEVEPRS